MKNREQNDAIVDKKNDISLAEWALVEEIRAGKWKNIDFARVAREDFGLNGIEFVNTLFESPHETYLKKLKQQAEDHGVTMVLIMVDEEGDGAAANKEERKQFAINHHKWVDIAHYLGCHAIRTNCRNLNNGSPSEAMNWAEESYNMLLEYAAPSNIRILIENHGGVSNDPDWMIAFMRRMNHPLIGILPDWRNPMPDFDNVTYLQKTIPFSKGMSYRNQPTEELTAKMIQMTKDAGYKGWFGIESKGREEVKKGIDYLHKYLSTESPQIVER
jgi:sugar phosphate isomerase/epimerase